MVNILKRLFDSISFLIYMISCLTVAIPYLYWIITGKNYMHLTEFYQIEGFE
jgi:hypothetical protein